MCVADSLVSALAWEGESSVGGLTSLTEVVEGLIH